LVVAIHRTLTNDDSALQKVYDWAAEFVSEYNEARRKEDLHRANIATYFLKDIFEAGRERLREKVSERPLKVTIPFLDGISLDLKAEQFRWIEYTAGAQQVAQFYPEGAPEYLNQYWELVNGGGTGLWRISAWTPPFYDPELSVPIPQLPIPPRSIGRKYSRGELSYGILALHDAETTLEPLVERGHSLDTALWRECQATLRGEWNRSLAIDPMPSDTWVESLQVLWERLLNLQKTPIQMLKVELGINAATVTYNGVVYANVDLSAAKALNAAYEANGSPISIKKHAGNTPRRVIIKLPEELRPLLVKVDNKGYAFGPLHKRPSPGAM
jgi:hypothetical protein